MDFIHTMEDYQQYHIVVRKGSIFSVLSFLPELRFFPILPVTILLNPVYFYTIKAIDFKLGTLAYHYR